MRLLRGMLLCLPVLVISVASSPAQSKDAEGCKDSPLISRFPGSVIYGCEDKADDTYTFHDLGPNHDQDKTIEGEHHYVKYDFPDTASEAQVYRNLVTALRRAGYTFDKDNGVDSVTAHMGKTWIHEELGGGGNYQQDIVIEIQLTQEVVANAAQLSGGLASNGHTVVDGIFFDTGKSEVKPESAAALQEVVKMLGEDPKMKVYVVGHTDNVGTLAANMELSRQRAAAVVQVLVGKYGVAAGRLSPYGDGPYAPVTSNDTENGRAQNRRVELVKQ